MLWLLACLFVSLDMPCLFVCLAGHSMIVCLFNWTLHDCLFVYLDFVMILAINKWPPGGAGVVLTSKTWNFHKFSMDFGDFWTIFRWILEFWAHTLALKVNVRSIPQVPNLLTSKPLKTSRNTQKLLSKPTKPLENRNFLIVLPKNANILLKYEKRKANSTQCSQAVTHPSTD